MVNAIQYDIFQSKEESEIECLAKEFGKVRESADKVRKGLYARNNVLEKRMLEIEMRQEIIERNICRGLSQ